MIVEYPNFLTESQCQLLIGMGESNQLQIGETSGDLVGYRKARVVWFDETNPIVSEIQQRVAELSGIPIENQERLHFVKYNVKGEYKLHHDGSKRRKTALIYLNTGFTGGETEFPKVERIIKPETGKLVIWENTTEDGEKIQQSYHAGLPIESGTKYILVIWIKR